MVAETPNPFGALLRQHRIRAGLSQEALAERAGLTPRGLLHLERGTRRPYPDTIHRLAEALNLAPAERIAFADAARPAAKLPALPPQLSTHPGAPVEDASPLAASAASLVGRKRELVILREQLAAALEGHGGLVLISGEAGAGKTALAESLCREAEGRGIRVLVGRCYDLSETPPYAPWTEALRELSPSPEMPPFPSVAQTVAVTPQQFFVEVGEFFAAVATKEPLVLLLDDLQWADPVSLDLLRFLGRSLASMPMLVLTTHRDDVSRNHPLSRLLPLLVRESRATRIDLPALSDEALRELGRQRYRLASPDEGRLVTFLAKRTEGNALFATELLRTLEERGIITSGGAELGDVEAVGVPTLLQQVIDARVSQLGEEAARLLGIAAVMGQEVPLDLWAQVVAGDEELVDEVAEHGIRARLLRETRGGTAVGFTHALFREALYEGIPGPRRRRIHRTIGEVLAGARGADPDAIAYHFRMAGDARAVAWLVEAGRRAYRSLAWLSAADRYAAALSLMDAQGEEGSVDRAMLAVELALLRIYVNPQQGIADLNGVEAGGVTRGDPLLRAIIRASRGRIRCLMGDYHGGLDDLAAGVTGLDALSDADHVRAAQLGDVIIRFVVDSSNGILAFFLATVGRFLEASAIAQQVLAAARSNDAPDISTANALIALIRVYAALGQPDEARRAFTHAREALQQLSHPMLHIVAYTCAFDGIVYQYATDDLEWRHTLIQAVDRIFAESIAGLVEYFPKLYDIPLRFLSGEWDDFPRLALAERSPSDVRGFMARCLLGMIARIQGNFVEAWDRVHDVLPAGPMQTHGDMEFFAALQTYQLAVALALDTQDLASARAWLDAYEDLLTWSGCIVGRSEALSLWARYERAAGRPQEAMARAQSALELALIPRQPRALQAAHLLLGELACESRNYPDAARHLHASLALADACVAAYERACTLVAMAEMQHGMDNRDEARHLVTEAQTILQSLHASPMLTRARMLEKQLA